MSNPFNATTHPLHFVTYEASLRSFVGDKEIDGGAYGNVEMMVNTAEYAANYGTMSAIDDDMELARALAIEALSLVGADGKLPIRIEHQEIFTLLDLALVTAEERIAYAIRNGPETRQLAARRKEMRQERERDDGIEVMRG